mgnify:CR=1 FL=1
MKNELVSIFRSKNQDVPTCDSRDLTNALGIEHKAFFNRVVLKYQAEIEKETQTPIILLSEKQQGKAGRPTRYAQLNVYQVMFALSMTSVTPKVLSAIAYILNDIMTKKIESPGSITPVWDGYAARMRPSEDMPVGIVDISDEVEYKVYEFFNETHFSPDEEFAKFLNSLETSLGYSLPFNLNTRYLQSFVARTNDNIYGTNTAAEFEEAEDVSDEEETEDDSDEDEDKYTEDEYYEACDIIYDSDSIYYTFDGEAPCHGYLNSPLHAVVNKQQRTLDLNKELLKTALEFVHTKDEFWEKKMQRISNEIKQHLKILGWGLQPHADFIDWWQDWRNLPSPNAPVYLETIYDIEKVSMPNHLFYEAQEVNGKAQLVVKEEPPIFDKLIVYPNYVKPLFEYYLEFVWYPEHSLKWLASVDNKSVSILCQAVNKATKFKLSKLDPSFVVALQTTLPEAPKQYSLR